MGGIRPSGLHVNKVAVFGLVAAVVAIFVVYKYLWSSTSLLSFSAFNFGSVSRHEESKAGVKDSGIGAIGGSETNEKTINIRTLSPPPTLDDAMIKQLPRENKTISVDLDGKKFTVYIEQVIPKLVDPKVEILLLHGMKFSSQDWMKIKTLYHLANWGYRAIAIDLPGKGNSHPALETEQYKTFLSTFVSTLQMKKVVIVAPSASGAVALPYLFLDPKTSTDRAVGFVPVAPVAADKFTAQYPHSKLPTLIVYGSQDPSGPTTLLSLKLLPQSRVAVIESAGHACYLDQPDDFHKALYNWLKDSVH